MEYIKATIPNCENLKYNLKNYLQKTIDESLFNYKLNIF